MFDNRPTFLTDDPSYSRLPSLPLGLDLGTVPDWIKLSLLHLGGVQPVTGAMANAAGGLLADRPSDGEIEMFRAQGAQFQTISVVVSVAHFREVDGVSIGTPYAISLIPASKRGAVSHVNVDFVRQIDLETARQRMEPCYLDFNPFTGDWGAFGGAGVLLAGEQRAGFPDGIGLVTDMYYLQPAFDPDDVLVADVGLGNGRPLQKYLRHRTRRLYRPFQGLQARRVWGAESPIELFLLQALLRDGITPQLQMLIYEDGTTYPSFYDLFAAELAEEPQLVTEADMYFPEHRLAVFCDSNRHHRGGRAAEKDRAIDERLLASGVQSVRVPGKLIVEDLRAAADLVREALR